MQRNPIARRSFASACVAMLLALSTAGCGFQPRGQATSLAGLPSPLHVSGVDPYSTLRRELEQQLRIAGVQLSAGAADSAAVLHVSNWTSDARLLSVNSRNKAVEYELEESARFRLRANDGRELVAEQVVRVVRIQYRPEVAVLGSEKEAELLRKDMRKDLAGRIVRRLAARP